MACHLFERVRTWGINATSGGFISKWAVSGAPDNLCHVVRTLRVTPAMQANVTDIAAALCP